MNKRYLLILVAIACVALFFYGSSLNQENSYLKALPTLGGLAFGLNTLIQLAH